MARYLIDANLPRHLAVWARCDCEFVADIDSGMPDSDVWKLATVRHRTIVTKDADFADRVFLSQTGPSVIHLRIGNMKFRQLDAFLDRVWTDVCSLSEHRRLVQVYNDRIEAIG